MPPYSVFEQTDSSKFTKKSNILTEMLKNPVIKETIDDFKYTDFLAADDFLAHGELDSKANPNLDESLPFYKQNSFAVPTNSSSLRSHEGDSHEIPEIFSDLVLDYIGQILMEEDMDDKFDMLQSHPALKATEKPFYEIIGEKYPPSPDHPHLYSCPSFETSEGFRGHHSNRNSIAGVRYSPDSDRDSAMIFHSQIYTAQDSINFLEGFDSNQDDFSGLFFKTIPASQFENGVEEAKKFLPSEDKLVVDVRAVGIDLPQEFKENIVSIADNGRGRQQKGRHDSRFDLEEQRSSKHSAVTYEESPVSREMFDMVLLCSGEKFPKVITSIREAMQNEAASKNPSEITEPQEPAGNSKKSRGKKKQPKKEVVDLHSLLIQCAQTVASGNHQSAHEVLRQVRQHSSPHGDASQRLAHYFANGLEARLAGTGSEIYHSIVSKRKTASDVLKAYQLYLAACPFKKLSYYFSNQTILDTVEKSSRVHILDFGIYFGFQWPSFLKMLADRPGGPPKLRITGIDVPQQGFRPTERIEETGHRLFEYAERFSIPFKYQVVASKLDEVRVEDLHLEEEEMLIVNCVFRLNSLWDETMAVDCPRDKLLSNIRKLNPALFVNVTSNGTYGAPFFVTRFREALYHFSALFDMLEVTVPREHEQRLLVERDLYGKFAINVISCEGTEREERPETYKQTQVRCLRAGFQQLPVSLKFERKAKSSVKAHYHKDFSIDEDGRWVLQGWRGRIFVALSAWKTRYY